MVNPANTAKIKRGVPMLRSCMLILLAMGDLDGSMSDMKQCVMPRIDERVIDVTERDERHGDW